MKKLNSFCRFLIGFLLLSSCSSSDNNESENDTLIIGTWNGKTTSDGEIPENDIISFYSNNTVPLFVKVFASNTTG